MREVDTGPLLGPDDRIRFLDDHRPALRDGDYRVTVTQTTPTLANFTATRSFDFAIGGPRFMLAPAEIASSYPPPGSSGDFEAVLPHVILHRSTLPWERSATDVERPSFDPVQTPPPPEEADYPPSWLALLVLTEDEQAGRVSTVKASELLTADVGAVAPRPTVRSSFATLSLASTDDPKTQVTVLDLPGHLADRLLPRFDDLVHLTSVREVNESDGRALVMANRLPSPGARNHVHLVSLEAQYHSTDPTSGYEHWSRQLGSGSLATAGPPTPDTVRLISLANWDFHCDASPGDLQTILQGTALRTLSLPTDGLGVSGRIVATGAVPVEHRLTTGTRTAAWYRGPLTVTRPSHDPVLPVRRSADLVTVDPDTGMADVTYAAAWELGRVLALKDPIIGPRLHQWKRRTAHTERASADAWIRSEIGHPANANPQTPRDVRHWLTNGLWRLAAVPFDYLVPDPALLPAESIAFFRVDRGWTTALVDGALSLGRTSSSHLEADRELHEDVPSLPSLSGMLLRSAAVARWPDLMVDGFQDQAGATKLTPSRFERIGPDTLLVLFDSALQRLDLHLHPQALHFGVDGAWAVPGDATRNGFTKNGVDLTYRAEAERVVDLATLASGLGASAAHDFSLAMIESGPRVSHTFQLHDD